MFILWMMIIGLLIGALAKLLVPGRDPGGVFITILVGIAGSSLAGIIGRSIGWYTPEEPTGFAASVIGAILLLFLYRAIKPRSDARKGGFGKAA